MPGKFPTLILLAPALLLPVELVAQDPARKDLSITSLFRPDSVLTDVMLPRYDPQQRLTSVLRAKSITVVDENSLDGDTVSVDMFHPDRNRNGRMTLTKVRFNQKTGTLKTRDAVTLGSPQVHATGTGLIYQMDQNQGFLMGPNITRIRSTTQSPTATTMNTPAMPLRRSSALLGAATCLLPISFINAAEPTAPETKPALQVMTEATAKTRADLRAALTASAEANRAATDFLEKEDMLAKADAANPQPTPSPATPDFQPNDEDTVITCDGGIHFDGDKGVLLFLKNVRIKSTEFTLDGANELTVFFGKKAPDPNAAEAPANADGKAKVDLNIGDLERIVATGALHLKQTEKQGNKPIEAAGAVLTFIPKSDTRKAEEITLAGGKPWIMRKGDGIIIRAKQDNQSVHISGQEYQFEGETEAIFPSKGLNLKDK